MSVKPCFKTSVLEMQPNLLSFALKLTLNKDEARDLVQDTTLKALDNEHKFVDQANFKGWMLTIMRNIFINNYHRKVRIVSVVDNTLDIAHMDLDQPDSHSAESGFAVSDISDAIASFPESCRKPFSMHMAGYKYEEIAEILQLPLGTVKSRIFFTRRSLREMLKDYR